MAQPSSFFSAIIVWFGSGNIYARQTKPNYIWAGEKKNQRGPLNLLSNFVTPSRMSVKEGILSS